MKRLEEELASVNARAPGDEDGRKAKEEDHRHGTWVKALGVKGVGESGAIPGAAAIANAVEDAVAHLGVTVREVPVTRPTSTPARPGARRRRALSGRRGQRLGPRVRERLEG